MDAAPELKYIGVQATAYAKVDFNYAGSKGIPVTNIPGYSTEAVAEFVFATLLEHIRELERGKNQARENISISIELFEQCEAEGFLKQAKEALASLV